MNVSIKAALWQLAAMFSFSVMGALVKYAGDQSIPAAELVFFRGLVGIPVLAVLAYRQKVDLRGSRRGLLLARGLAGTTALFMFFWAVTQIPIANAVLLNQATPIFVLPMAVLFLGERVTIWHVVFALVAIAGVILVIKPGADLFNLPGVVALVSASFAAVAYVLVSKLTRTESSLTIVFWFSVTATVVAAPVMLSNFVMPSPRMMLVVIAMGLAALSGQLLLTRAYRIGEAARLAVIGSLGAIFGAGWDLVIWSHLPDVWTTLGGLTAIGACTAIQVLRHSKTAPRYLSG